jgi:hypothetical protein
MKYIQSPKSRDIKAGKMNKAQKNGLEHISLYLTGYESDWSLKGIFQRSVIYEWIYYLRREHLYKKRIIS